MKKLLLLLVLTASGFVCKKLCAQIVNIEDRRATLDSTGVYWQGDFGGKLTQNTSKSKKMGENAREYVISNFIKDEILDGMIQKVERL